MTNPQTDENSATGDAEADAAAASAKPSAPARRSGLGRGLSALIPQLASAQRPPQPAVAAAPASLHPSPPPKFRPEPSPPPASGEPAAAGALRADAPGSQAAPPNEPLRVIALRSISLNPQQPRKEFKREELDDLTASIKEHGILQPIAVRAKGGGGDDAAYELIAGERRFRAASAAGLTEVPALVRADVSDRESLALAIIENVQRENLNIIEAAQGYDELLHAYNMTQTELAHSIGKSQPQIANALRLLNLPQSIQDSLRSSLISEGHAKVILSVKTEPEQIALWKEVVQQGLTVRSAEKRAAAVRAAAAPKPAPAPAPAPASAKPDAAPAGALASASAPSAPLASSGGAAHLDEVARLLSLSLGTKVRLLPKSDGGTIEISYFDSDQLDDLIEKLGGDS